MTFKNHIHGNMKPKTTQNSSFWRKREYGRYVIIAYAILRLFLLFKNRNVGVLKNKHFSTVKRSEPEKKQSKITVAIKTFNKWPFHKDFSVETDEEGYIKSLDWKVCRDNLAHIRNEKFFF